MADIAGHGNLLCRCIGCIGQRGEDRRLKQKLDEELDKNCHTLPDGDCIGGPCMHNPDGPPVKRERRGLIFDYKNTVYCNECKGFYSEGDWPWCPHGKSLYSFNMK